VFYAAAFYGRAESVAAKEQLLHELVAGLDRTELACLL